MRQARSRALALLLGGLIVAVTPAVAQTYTFNPSISLNARFNNDVELVDSESPSDISYRLGLTLPVVRTLRNGNASFTYSPVFERFQDLDQFDQTGHRLSIGVSLEPTPRSNFGVRASYISTQDQGDVESFDGTDLLFNRRAGRDRAIFDLNYGNRLGPRWRWRGSVGFSDWKFDEVADNPDDTLLPFDDRSALRGSAVVLRDLSTTTAVGFSYGIERFELDRGDEETSHLGSVVLERRLGPRLNGSLALGVVFTDGLRIGRDAEEIDVSRTSAQGRATLQRSFRHVALRLSVAHRPSAGGSRLGTSTNSTLGASLTSELTRRVDWQLFSRYARRDSNEDESQTLDSVAVGTNIDFRLTSKIGLRLGLAYINRLDQEQNAEGVFLTSGLGLVWYPFERMKFAGGGDEDE